MWHGCSWSTHEILGQEPLYGENQASYKEVDLEPYNWEWVKNKPAVWEPCVKFIANQMVEVSFYSYSGLGYERIYKHIDLYNSGNYVFSSDSDIIASGQGGYIF